MKPRSYDDLSKQELIEQLKARDRKDATRFGLVWEADEIDRDKALNSDFVALNLDSALSQGDGPWRNLIIEGDNYDALRALKLGFAGRVKCIYIDPPYNTGNKDFVYNDRFVDKEHAWRHSLWCEFMFRRLELAKDLLAPDGVIFVSIDDNEAAALKLLLGKVFAEQNAIATFIWRKVDSPNDNKVAITPDHEYILAFGLNKDLLRLRQMHAPHIVGAYGSIGDDGIRYRDRLLKKNGKNSLKKDRPTMCFPLKGPDGIEVLPVHENGEEARWAMGCVGVEKHRAANTLIWKKKQKLGKEVWEPYTREFAPAMPTRPWPTIWSDLPTSRQAKAMLRDIFDSVETFSTPKPVELLERALQIGAGPNDIILDFFAGSGTTAHAVAKLNASDGGNRRFILVSSTEATLEEPHKNICRDVCAERVRRVMTGYSETAGMGGNFAYLRCRRIAESELIDIAHEQVWTALQLLHRESLQPYAAKALHWREDESESEGLGALAYVERLGVGTLAELKRLIRSVPSALIYTWQAAALRNRLEQFEHIQIESIPQSLARKFGFKIT